MQRKFKVLFACIALVAIFSHNLVIHFILVLTLGTFYCKKIINNKSYVYLLIFSAATFFPYFIWRNNAYLPIAVLFICRSLILYFALMLIAANINLEKLRGILTKLCGRKFTLALTLAFNLLPLIKRLLQINYAMFYLQSRKHNSKLKQINAFALSILRQIIHTAESCAENLIIIEQLKRPKIFLITGAKHSGKTTFAEELATKLQKRQWPISGLLAPSTINNNRRATIYATNLRTKEKKLLASRELKITDIVYEYGGFNFSQQGLEFARHALREIKPHEIVFLDEYGPLEFANLGYAAEFKLLIQAPIAALFIVIRQELVPRFFATHAGLNCEVITISSENNVKISAPIGLAQNLAIF